MLQRLGLQPRLVMMLLEMRMARGKIRSHALDSAAVCAETLRHVQCIDFSVHYLDQQDGNDGWETSPSVVTEE